MPKGNNQQRRREAKLAEKKTNRVIPKQSSQILPKLKEMWPRFRTTLFDTIFPAIFTWGVGEVLGHFTPYLKVVVWLLAFVIWVIYKKPFKSNVESLLIRHIGILSRRKRIMRYLSVLPIFILIIGAGLAFNPIVNLITVHPQIYQGEPPTFVDAQQEVTFQLGGNDKFKAIVVSFTWGDLMKEHRTLFYVGKNQVPLPITVYVENGKLYADVQSIWTGTNSPPMELDGYVFNNRPPNWDANFNGTTLEIVDDKQQPRFQFIYRTEFDIAVNGIFYIGQNDFVLAGGTVTYIDAPEIGDFSIGNPIFRYPSKKYPGEMQITAR
jgi:hypothetical protein